MLDVLNLLLFPRMTGHPPHSTTLATLGTLFSLYEGMGTVMDTSPSCVFQARGGLASVISQENADMTA